MAMAASAAFQTIAQLSRRLSRRELSARELTLECLERIDAANPTLNAFLTVAREQAIARAELADRELKSGRRRGPLHGIPYAVKDVIATRGVTTSNGSRAARRPSQEDDATVVARLNRAGAVLVGKLNLWEFAMTGAVFGDVRNPWHTDFSASGSSGGSAAAVAAGLVPLAIGTDTGGSIRVPAAHCGVVGLRPTYGRVSRHGVTPNAWSVDTVGPLTRSAADAALAFQAISGPDPADRTTTASPAAGVEENAAVVNRSRWRIGLVKSQFDAAHPEVTTAVTEALKALERLGHTLLDVDVPHAGDAAAARTLHLAEAAAFHEQRLLDAGSDSAEGSRGSGPASVSSTCAASATVRAIGPT